MYFNFILHHSLENAVSEHLDLLKLGNLGKRGYSAPKLPSCVIHCLWDNAKIKCPQIENVGALSIYLTLRFFF